MSDDQADRTGSIPADPSPFSVNLTSDLQKKIAGQAASDYPLETCGFLLGREEGGSFLVQRLVAAENRNAADPRHRFEIDRRDYGLAEALSLEAGMMILGVYHSHPDAAPVPSAADAEYAFPGWICWITPVMGERPGAPRAWLRDSGARSWREMAINVRPPP